MVFLKGVTSKESHVVIGFHREPQYRKYVRNPNYHFPDDQRYYIYAPPKDTLFALTACGFDLELSSTPKRFKGASCNYCRGYVSNLDKIRITPEEWLAQQ